MKKIMFVDDEKDQIFAVKSGFETLYPDQYEIIAVNSGKQCFDFLKKKIIPDLILLDIMMPKMDGWEVFDKLRGNDAWKHIPVIFLTARSDGFAVNAGRMIGDDYVEKPVEIDELKTRIEAVLEKYRKVQ
jgi:DNA-binding response OmpR family regulator